MNGGARRSWLLLTDALVNLGLGLLLLGFPDTVVRFLGAPTSESAFYPSVLGGVLLGIAIALLVECRSGATGCPGLGLVGAVCINLVAGVVLAGWLLLGNLEIPARGRAFLWALVGMLVVVSLAETLAQARRTKRTAALADQEPVRPSQAEGDRSGGP